MLANIWRSRGPGAWLLLPIALVFSGLSAIRRGLFKLGWLKVVRLKVPVVVVGNITSGGSGKTPLVFHLACQLQAYGRRPGIVSRGFGRRGSTAMEVLPDSDVSLVGDEPLLLKRKGRFPVFVGRRRADAARALLARHPDCDVILCDDGLQHYALGRDVEIAVLDRRGLMNGLRLPAGPLREPVQRMRSVDAIVLNGLDSFPGGKTHVFRMTLTGNRFYLLGDESQRISAVDLAGLHLHAVAGIGDPHRFFDQLHAQGLQCDLHVFADHHGYVASELEFCGDAILTTEKDAVKLEGLSALPVWVQPVEAQVEPDLARFVLEKLNGSASA